MFFLLSANDDKPVPGAPDAADLAKWDSRAAWGNKGTSLGDAPNNDGISIGKQTLWGPDHEPKDGSMILKPGFVIHEIGFSKDESEAIVKEILKEIE